MGLAQFPAIDDHAVAGSDTRIGGLLDGTREVDARDQRKLADDLRPPADGQCVLVKVEYSTLIVTSPGMRSFSFIWTMCVEIASHDSFASSTLNVISFSCADCSHPRAGCRSH